MGPENQMDVQKFSQTTMDDFLKKNKGDLENLLISNQMPRGQIPNQMS